MPRMSDVTFDESKLHCGETDWINRHLRQSVSGVITESHVRLIGAGRIEPAVGHCAGERSAQLTNLFETIGSEKHHWPAWRGECHEAVEARLEWGKADRVGCTAGDGDDFRRDVMAYQIECDVESIWADPFARHALGSEQIVGNGVYALRIFG